MTPNSRNRHSNATTHTFAIEALEERTVLSVTPLGEELISGFDASPGYLLFSTPPVTLTNDSGYGGVVWLGYKDSNSDPRLIFQPIESGSALSIEPITLFQLEDYSEFYSSFDADIDGEGKLSVVWGASNNFLYLFQFDASGSLIGDGLSISNAVDDQMICSLDVNESGEVAVSWNQSGSVFVRKYLSNGIQAWTAHVTTAPGDLPFVSHDVAIDDTGAITIVWSQDIDESETNVVYQAQRYLPDGSAVPGTIEIAEAVRNPSHFERHREPPRIAMNGSGQFTVTWTDAVEGNPDDRDVFARIFDANGLATTEVFRVNDETVGIQQYAYAAINNSGQIAFTWSTADVSEVPSEVVTRTFDIDGVALSGDLTLAVGPPDSFHLSTVTLTETGEALTAWETSSLLDQNNVRNTIQGQWHNGSGISLTDAFPVNYPRMGPAALMPQIYQLIPGAQVATNSTGDKVVTYIADAGLVARIYPSAEPGVVKTVIVTPNGLLYDVAMAANGNFLATWNQASQEGWEGIFAQWYAIDGTPIGEQIILQSPADQVSPIVCIDTAGIATIAWQYDDIAYLQRVDPTGNLLGLPTELGPSEGVLSAATNEAGTVAILWSQETITGSYRLLVTQLDSHGEIVTTTTVTDDASYQFTIGLSTIALDPDGGFIVVWEQRDSSTPEVWARRFDSFGDPKGNAFIVGEPSVFNWLPSVISVAPGEYVISWRGGNYHGPIHLQHYIGANPVGPIHTLPPATRYQYTLAAGAGAQLFLTTLQQQNYQATLTLHELTVNDAPVAEVLLPTLGLRTDGGAGHAVRGQELEIELVATDPWSSDSEADYVFRIDWDNDGEFDEVVTGPSGLKVSRLFTEVGEYLIGVEVEDIDGGVSETVTANLIVTDWDKRLDEDDPSLVHLVVGGTMGNDAFAFLPGYMLTQLENNTYFPTPRSTAVGSFNGQIHVYAQAGDDLVLADVMQNTMLVHGGEGNDLLVGGRGSDSLFGGVGDDMIFGGTMESDLGDWLEGGEGNDLLFGWLGGDTVTGGDGEDLIAAGSLDFANLPEAIYSIQSEWLAPRPQQERIANLSGTGTGDRFNNDFFLTPGQTVLDDAAVDLIHGGLLQSDWVLSGEADLVTGNPEPLVQVGEEEWVNLLVMPIGFYLPPTTTVLADGTTYVTWSAVIEEDGEDIYVVRQQIDAAGNRIGAPVAIASPGSNYIPDAAVDAAGNLLVVWRPDDHSGEVYFSRFDASGEQIGETELVAQPGSNQLFLTLTAIDVNEQGEAIISWNQKNGVFVRKVSAEGVLGEVTQVPGSAAVNSFFLSDVAISETGEFTVVWTGWTSGDGKIYRAQSFDALGNAGAVMELGEFIIDEDFSFYEAVFELPRVSMASSGQFVVTWSGRVGEGDYDVYARSYDADGTPLSDTFVVNEVTADYQYLPYVSVNDNGSFVIGWSTSDYTYDHQWTTPGIYARSFATDGTPLTGDVTILEGEAAAHQVASVGVTGNGDYVVNWGTHWWGYTRDSINGAWVDAAGTVTTEPFRIDQSAQPVGTWPYTSYIPDFPGPQSAVNGNGDRVVVWHGAGGLR